jgi:hypothetical protein
VNRQENLPASAKQHQSDIEELRKGMTKSMCAKAGAPMRMEAQPGWEEASPALHQPRRSAPDLCVQEPCVEVRLLMRSLVQKTDFLRGLRGIPLTSEMSRIRGCLISHVCHFEGAMRLRNLNNKNDFSRSLSRILRESK